MRIQNFIQPYLVLEHAQGASHMPVLFSIRHVAHVVNNLLVVRIHGVKLSEHLAHLQSHHVLGQEVLAKGLPLVSPQHDVFQRLTRAAQASGANSEAFMVEIVHDLFESAILLAHEVRCWDLRGGWLVVVYIFARTMNSFNNALTLTSSKVM